MQSHVAPSITKLAAAPPKGTCGSYVGSFPFQTSVVIPVASWQRKFSQDQECNQATSRKMVPHAWNLLAAEYT
jgi:hypothetical protein